jgi:hypothetical protein
VSKRSCNFESSNPQKGPGPTGRKNQPRAERSDALGQRPRKCRAP